MAKYSLSTPPPHDLKVLLSFLKLIWVELKEIGRHPAEEYDSELERDINSSPNYQTRLLKRHLINRLCNCRCRHEESNIIINNLARFTVKRRSSTLEHEEVRFATHSCRAYSTHSKRCIFDHSSLMHVGLKYSIDESIKSVPGESNARASSGDSNLRCTRSARDISAENEEIS